MAHPQFHWFLPVPAVFLLRDFFHQASAFFVAACVVDDRRAIAGVSVSFFFQAEDGIRDHCVTGVQTCALPISTNSIKQAAEFGIVKGGQKLAALLLFITDVKAIGLETAQGLNFTETFYWDLNDKTREFSKKFASRMKNGAPPSMVQAGVYSGVIHYLKALEALGGNPHDGIKVVEKMKSMPTDHPLFGKGEIQPNR